MEITTSLATMEFGKERNQFVKQSLVPSLMTLIMERFK
jgi:hypothetical protein